MKQHRQFLKKVIYPHVSLVILLALASAIALTIIFIKGLEESIFAYGIYAVSAYSLTIVVVRLVFLWKAGKDRLLDNAFYHRYSTDLDFKAVVSIHLSLAVTLFYCVTKAAAGIYYRSAWFGSMAFYYTVLGVVRYLLLRHIRREQGNTLQAYKKYRFCGYLLLVLTVALGAMSFHTIYDNKAIEYPGFLIYAAAGFTFYNLTMAVFNLVRYGRLHNPIYSASKILALATASVSLFFLQTSMFSAFGDGGKWQYYMNMGTGAVVFVLIVCFAVFMIWTGTRAIAIHKEKQK